MQLHDNGSFFLAFAFGGGERSTPDRLVGSMARGAGKTSRVPRGRAAPQPNPKATPKAKGKKKEKAAPTSSVVPEAPKAPLSQKPTKAKKEDTAVTYAVTRLMRLKFGHVPKAKLATAVNWDITMIIVIMGRTLGEGAATQKPKQNRRQDAVRE